MENRDQDHIEFKEGDGLVAEAGGCTDAPTLNADDYLADLSGFDLTDEQAAELLGTLWQIMKAFVDLGFGVDSIHHFLPALGEDFAKTEASPVQSGEDQFIQEFENCAQQNAEREEES